MSSKKRKEEAQIGPVTLGDFEKELKQYVQKVEKMEAEHAELEQLLAEEKAKISKAKTVWKQQALDYGESKYHRGRQDAESALAQKCSALLTKGDAAGALKMCEEILNKAKASAAVDSEKIEDENKCNIQ